MEGMLSQLSVSLRATSAKSLSMPVSFRAAFCGSCDEELLT